MSADSECCHGCVKLTHALEDALHSLASVSMELDSRGAGDLAPMTVEVARAVFDFTNAIRNSIGDPL